MLLTSTLLFLGQLVAAGPRLATTAPAPATLTVVAPVVSGRVVTELEEPLPGVVVTVQGAADATSTNATGDFLLPLRDTKSVLVFKCQGYRDQLVNVAASNAITVKMYALTSTAGSRPAAPAAEEGKPLVLGFSEVLPSFPGGDAAYRAFLSKNAHFPAEAQEKGASGTVYVGFVVDEQGRIINAELVRGAGHGFDEEALRVVRLMPWWNPGRMGGKAVRVSRVLPVSFVFRERQ